MSCIKQIDYLFEGVNTVSLCLIIERTSEKANLYFSEYSIIIEFENEKDFEDWLSAIKKYQNEFFNCITEIKNV